MKEILNVRQHPGERRRRWFVSDAFELIVWFEEPDQIFLFELSYDLKKNWRALRWNQLSGFTHHKIDDGEARPFWKSIPILVPNPEKVPEEIFEQFVHHSKSLDPFIISFVCARLVEYQASLHARDSLLPGCDP